MPGCSCKRMLASTLNPENCSVLVKSLRESISPEIINLEIIADQKIIGWKIIDQNILDQKIMGREIIDQESLSPEISSQEALSQIMILAGHLLKIGLSLLLEKTISKNR